MVWVKYDFSSTSTLPVNEKNNKFVKASLNKSSKALSCEFRLPDGTKHVRQALIDGDASKSWIQIAQMLIIVFDFVKTLGNFKRFRLLNDGCVNENRNARFIKFLSFMTQKEDLIELTQETACQHELSFSPDRIHGTQRRRTKKIARDEGINITSHKDMVDIGNKFISKTVADKKSEKELRVPLQRLFHLPGGNLREFFLRIGLSNTGRF